MNKSKCPYLANVMKLIMRSWSRYVYIAIIADRRVLFMAVHNQTTLFANIVGPIVISPSIALQ